MVFIQIGGSDLVCSTPNIHFAQYLLDGCGVKYVIIGQVLRRDPRRSTATFNDDVVNFYISLASACAILLEAPWFLGLDGFPGNRWGSYQGGPQWTLSREVFAKHKICQFACVC